MYQLLAPLDESTRQEFFSLWEEHEKKETLEAKFVSAVDYLEGCLQYWVMDIEKWTSEDYKVAVYYRDERYQFDAFMKEFKAFIDEKTMEKFVAAGKEAFLSPDLIARYQQNRSSAEQPVIDCGLGNLTNENATSACLTPRFQACSPTKIRTEIDLGAFGGIVGYEYEILGPQNNGCRVRSRFTSNPNPDYLNKDLFCVYNNQKPFSEAVQEVLPRLDACSGDLKPYLVSR